MWDGTIIQSGRAVDFMSADFFRIEDGVAAEHWDTVDYVRLYQSFGLLPDDVEDASISTTSPPPPLAPARRTPPITEPPAPI